MGFGIHRSVTSRSPRPLSPPPVTLCHKSLTLPLGAWRTLWTAPNYIIKNIHWNIQNMSQYLNIHMINGSQGDWMHFGRVLFIWPQLISKTDRHNHIYNSKCSLLVRNGHQTKPWKRYIMIANSCYVLILNEKRVLHNYISTLMSTVILKRPNKPRFSLNWRGCDLLPRRR